MADNRCTNWQTWSRQQLSRRPAIPLVFPSGVTAGFLMAALLLFAGSVDGQSSQGASARRSEGSRAITCKAPQGKNVVFYMNGMNTTFASAALSVVELQDKFRSSSDASFADTAFLLAYNQTRGGLRDLAESILQRCNENALDCRRLPNVSMLMAQLALSALGNSSCQATAKASASEPAANEPLARHRDPIPLAADLRSHELAIENKLLEGNRVLIVAHSQGNFFANAALKVFGAMGGGGTAEANNGRSVYRNSLGVVRVASPSAITAGDHITSTADIVIRMVNSAVGGGVQGTCTNRVTRAEDCLHHGFVETYLNGDNCGPMVIGRMQQVLGGLTLPEQRATGGIITITLSWGPEPDVDLHVREPSGSHVFYKSMRGRTGYLDVDDRNGHGPEHYFVACDKLEPGSYTFGVNYFSGRGATVARVQVQAGLQVKQYSKGLNRGIGGRGDNTWQPMGTITVSGDSSSRDYSFTIQ